MSTAQLGLMLVLLLPSVVEMREVFTTRPAWKTKLSKFFEIMDVNMDGVVTEEEHNVLTAQRAENVLPHWRAMAVYGSLAQHFQIWWSNNITNYAKSLSVDDFLRSVETLDGPSISSPIIDSWANDWFHMLDLDCDGELTMEEYSNFLTIFRNEASVEIIFGLMDIDKDGRIVIEEFTTDTEHFMYDGEGSFAAYIFGARENGSTPPKIQEVNA